MLGGRRSLSVVAVVAALVLSAAACGGGGGQDEGGSEANGFSFGISAPRFLGPPSRCYNSECGPVINVLYTGLTDYDFEKQEIVYKAAKSIESKDNKTWTITLREGWTFHNGEPMNADSFIRAWNWTAYGPNGADTNGFFSTIKGYDAMNPAEGKPTAKKLSGLKKLSEYKFQVTLNEPFNQWPLAITYTPAFAPMAKECLADIKACNIKPIGNGPYKMVGEWERNEQIVVEKWDGYKGPDAGHAGQITFKLYQSIATQFKDWRSGELDITDVLPEDLSQARSVADERILEEPNSGYTYLGYPTYQDTYKNKKIRQALSLAINREAIAKNILAGSVEAAGGIAPSMIEGSRSDACEYCQYDPQRAKKIMKSIGGFPDDKMTIWFNAGAGHEEWTQAIGNGWRETFGVEFQLKSLQWDAYLNKLDNGEVTGPYRLTWGMDYPSMINYLAPLYTSYAETNRTGWTNKKVEDLIAEGRTADSVEQSVKTYQQAADIVMEEMPIIPLWFGLDTYVWSEDVTNVNYNPQDEVVMTDVKMAEE